MRVNAMVRKLRGLYSQLCRAQFLLKNSGSNVYKLFVSGGEVPTPALEQSLTYFDDRISSTQSTEATDLITPDIIPGTPPNAVDEKKALTIS